MEWRTGGGVGTTTLRPWASALAARAGKSKRFRSSEPHAPGAVVRTSLPAAASRTRRISFAPGYMVANFAARRGTPWTQCRNRSRRSVPTTLEGPNRDVVSRATPTGSHKHEPSEQLIKAAPGLATPAEGEFVSTDAEPGTGGAGEAGTGVGEAGRMRSCTSPPGEPQRKTSPGEGL